MRRRRLQPSSARAAVLAALTLSGAVRVWHLFTLAALLGIANAFDIPARQSFVIEIDDSIGCAAA